MNKIYRISEFAKRIGKSADTLRRWDREGRLVAKRHASGHRYYEESDIAKALGIEPMEGSQSVVVYARVSSRGQLPDLKRQVAALEQFCLGAGIAVDQWVEEVGGGMNFKRKKFLAILEQIETGEISKLIIAHKDRLVRFGFDYFEWFAARHGCEIVVVNQASLSPQQELVEDLMTIIHTFSARLYGLRNYRQKIKEAAEASDE
jgi:predicted site-specific integrase-resolvase